MTSPGDLDQSRLFLFYSSELWEEQGCGFLPFINTKMMVVALWEAVTCQLIGSIRLCDTVFSYGAWLAFPVSRETSSGLAQTIKLPTEKKNTDRKTWIWIFHLVVRGGYRRSVQSEKVFYFPLQLSIFSVQLALLLTFGGWAVVEVVLNMNGFCLFFNRILFYGWSFFSVWGRPLEREEPHFRGVFSLSVSLKPTWYERKCIANGLSEGL